MSGLHLRYQLSPSLFFVCKKQKQKQNKTSKQTKNQGRP